MARKSKELINEKGVLSTPDPSSVLRCLQQLSIVSTASTSLMTSAELCQAKKIVSVKQEGGKCVHLQKRLVLNNLKEVYREFKDQFPAQKVGFSKFAKLRPKHCIHAGASGTHSVCVCTIHQNVKLMMSFKLPDLPTYHDCLANKLCNPPLPRCYLGDCTHCPGITMDLQRRSDHLSR